MNRGSDAHITIYEGAEPASMRPRFMNRGSTGLPTSLTRPWYCFNEAPIHESGKCWLLMTKS